MQTNIIRSLLMILFLLPLIGCFKTREQINEENRKTQEKTRQAQMEVMARREQQEDLLDQVRQLNGRVEGLEQKLAHEERQKADLQKTIEQKSQEQQEKFKIFEEALTGMEKNVQALAAEMAEQKSKTTAASKPSTGSGKDLFDEGEKWFDKKEWSKGVLSYQQYREKHPKGKYYPEATYKMGVCFEEMKQRDEANAFYEEVVSKFPTSTFAKKAKYRLGKKQG